MHVDPQISDKASSEHPSSLNDSLATVHAEDARRIGYSTTQPSSTEPDPAEKLLCRYWIRTGECDWGNNCKFKHEMPRTIHEMRKAGYLEYPKWWEEQKRIRTVPRGTTWIQDRVASRSQDAGSSRGAPEPRAFPNPSTFRTKQAEVRTVTHDGPSARSVPQQSVLSKQTKVLPISPLLAPIPEASIRRESHIENLLIDLDDTPTPQSSRVSSFNDEDYDDRTSSSRSSASSPASCVVIQPTLPITVATATEPKTATWEGKEKEQPYRHDVRRLSQSSWDSDSGMGETAIKPPGKRKTTHRKTTSRPNAPEKRHAGLSHPKNATAATNVNNNQANNAEAHGKNVSRKAPQHKGNEVGAMDLHTRIEQHRRNANQKVRTRKIGSGNVAAAPVVVEQISGV
ncbi:hypothetical protein CC86DRAFT_367495 [Ophiobolus disseminans]|uniref:C3H1-type domain-containing protein n=1 Tax=Ophiobolus disseminans TaxID=1469910 RepID=A0A6A7AC02_9PLEO|nr:hypothetical protein CC86DRAFT_367495 [Ophiobolus disseminans]